MLAFACNRRKIAKVTTVHKKATDATRKVYKMATQEELILLIDKAAVIAGNQTKLAEMLDMHKSHITQMKQGSRAASWRVRGKLRAIVGEDPTHAFMAAMVEDLGQSENEDEKKAAAGFKAMLAAFPDDVWRKRRDSNPR